MIQPDGKKLVLRSRGSGNGIGQAYFNIYIEDPDGGGTAALRGDPVLFVYNGMTPEQAAEETNDTEGAAANLPTLTPTERAQYWMDVNNGSDMGGYTYHFRTGAINSLTENLGSSFPTFFDVQYYDEFDKEVKEIHFLPRILTETREGVEAERWMKAYGKSGEDSAASLQSTADKGYVLVGRTTSSGAGGSDLWVLKLNSGGSMEWKKTYGGASSDAGAAIEQTRDGG
jgi:hypothetical protein